MKFQTRRTFMASITTIGAILSGFTIPFKRKKNALSHHVFFWLKNPNSRDDVDKLIKGLNSLRKIETIRGLHIGVPASTEKRDVVDNSFTVSELMFFDSVADQNAYQEHPIHKRFVEECSELWEKVIVYDAVEVE